MECLDDWGGGVRGKYSPVSKERRQRTSSEMFSTSILGAPFRIFSIVGFTWQSLVLWPGTLLVLSDSHHFCLSATNTIQSTLSVVDPRGHSASGVGLRPLACWDCGIESCRRAGMSLLVSFVLSDKDFYASGRSLFQRIANGRVMAECDHEASIMSSPWHTRSFCSMGYNIH
jgi:hypothetical protein